MHPAPGFLPLPSSVAPAGLVLALVLLGCGDERPIPSESHDGTPSITSPTPDERGRGGEILAGLGYLGGTEAPTTSKIITVIKRDMVSPGLNFFVSGHGPEALLIDMDGRVVHRWHYPFEKAWPALPDTMTPERGYRDGYKDHFRRAHLYPNGAVLAIFDGFGMVKIDKDSNLIWARLNRAHHDLQVMPDGEIYVLTHRVGVLPWLHESEPVIDEFVALCDGDGNEKWSYSLVECLRRSGFRFQAQRPAGYLGPLEILHANTVEVLDGRHAAGEESLSSPTAKSAGRPVWVRSLSTQVFKKGHILTSMRALDLIAVIDPDRQVAVWWMTGTFKKQHEPILLGNGHLLLFDNTGRRDQSAVLEFRPFSGEVIWSYDGTADRPFFSEIGGTAARLPNGNTLITESVRGRVFEVTSEGEIVWEFVSPLRAGEQGQFVAMVYEMIRIPPDFPLDWLDD
ncbi:MAG: arylsulfotransferase family protein [Planctomycetota bacterium]